MDENKEKLINEISKMREIVYFGLKPKFKKNLSELNIDELKKACEELKKSYYVKIEELYYKRLNLTGQNNDSLSLVFETVSENRKFEIELYWKRTAYFWALIAMVFAAYFSFITMGKIVEYRRVYLTLISSIGSVLTFAWILANKGSKFWQENWENHMDLIENKITGPLYKTLLHRPTEEDAIELESEGVRKRSDFITKPKEFSVSKINQLIGSFILIIWFVQILWVLVEECVRAFYLSDFYQLGFCIVIIGFSILFSCFIYREARTHTGKTNPVMLMRAVKISNIVDKEKK
ncbi:RipA family octameric membrane protein [Providencia stuartii]